ncbi:MAG TPA: hypothetical protein VN887_13275 [Candidatus Angelobacter sp.]|nr:hypothetical protein [Candidatus Angelobacter sp.]
MNEIKFACPHCQQHIACDEGYCGHQIACPACAGGMIVPRLAAFGFGATTNLSLALPVATPVPRAAATPALLREYRMLTGQKRGYASGEGAATSSRWEAFTGILRSLVTTVLVLAGFAVLGLAILFAGCALLVR